MCKVLRKIKTNDARILQRKSKSVVTMYKWSNTVKWVLNLQTCNWKKLKTAVRNKTGATLRMSLKILMEMICLNYYWQQDKKQGWEMHLIIMSTDL